jgi:hypothetical protein
LTVDCPSSLWFSDCSMWFHDKMNVHHSSLVSELYALRYTTTTDPVEISITEAMHANKPLVQLYYLEYVEW